MSDDLKRPEEIPLSQALRPALGVLKQMDGYIVFADRDGEEFVLMSLSRLNRLRQAGVAAQLSFEDVRPVHRSPALEPVETPEEEGPPPYDELSSFGMHVAEDEDMGAAPDEEDLKFTSNEGRPGPPPVRVRFEPLEGEISPDLQE